MVKDLKIVNGQELSDIIENEFFVFGMRVDGIGYLFLKDNVEITVELQGYFIKAHNEILNGESFPIIYEPGQNCNITKEARENAILIEDLSPIAATAVIAPNSIYKLIATFYLKFNKPKKPYKVFKNVDEAAKWLKDFV
jgi:hypothetical protein